VYCTCTALQDEAGVLQDVYDRQQRGISSAKSRLSVVSTVLVGWAVVITVAIVVLLVVAFTRLRRSRLLDVPMSAAGSAASDGRDAVASWSCDAEVGLPSAVDRPSTLLESDMEPDDLPVDMSRLSSLCKPATPTAGSSAGAVISEDELNTRDIPRFVHTAAATSSST